MTSAKPGHFWKTPFVCESGFWRPAKSNRLTFEEADESWLREALEQAVTTSLSESDRYLTQRLGPGHIADELLSLAELHFIRPPHWWRLARDPEGHAIGFVLPVLFKEPKLDPQGQGRPEGTIFHMGVLPEFRGRGYALDLINEATSICLDEGRCWRIFCDTSSNNTPMLKAFRQAGYSELAPWQRPIA